MPSSHLILGHPLLLLPSIPPRIKVFSNESTHEVAKVLELQLYHHSFQRNPRVHFLQNGLVGSPCSPRDCQESSPWTIAHQTPLSTGLPRQEYWSWLPFPPPGDLPHPGIKPVSCVSCIGRQILYCSATWEAQCSCCCCCC